MGLGLAALGRPSYINAGRDQDFGADRSLARFERQCHEMLDAAYAADVRYVDAARSYGMAEDFLGRWLAKRRLPPGAMTVGSKWGYAYVGAWQVDAPVHEVKELSIATLRRQIGESRERLGDQLRLYQIHSATLESGVLDDRTVLEELDRLRSGGLAIGLTVSGPRQADVIRRALAVQPERFESLPSRSSDLESPRTFRRRCTGRGEADRLGRHCQGTARQRTSLESRGGNRPAPERGGERSSRRR